MGGVGGEEVVEDRGAFSAMLEDEVGVGGGLEGSEELWVEGGVDELVEVGGGADGYEAEFLGLVWFWGLLKGEGGRGGHCWCEFFFLAVLGWVGGAGELSGRYL